LDDENVVGPLPPGGEVTDEEAPTVAQEPGAAEAPATAPVTPAEEVARLRDRWLRAEAELQNFRRRATRDREETRRSAEEAVMQEIIGALDDLERGLRVAVEAGAPEPWTAGVRLVAGRLVDYLARQGVVALDPVGEPFDPAFHEAVLEVEAPGVEPGHVAEVVLRGWRRGERALRAARVVVARHVGEGE